MSEAQLCIGGVRQWARSENAEMKVRFAHALRGVAAACVLMHHFLYTFWHEPRTVSDLIVYPLDLPAGSPSVQLPDFGLTGFWGHFGVALFFLISGFVIPFSVGALSRTGFAVARVLRIWPTYMLGLSITLLCIAANAVSSQSSFPYRVTEVINHYLIAPRWPTLTRPIDGIIWTLEIELAFYALCILIRRRIMSASLLIFGWALLSLPFCSATGSLMPMTLGWGRAIFSLLHWCSCAMQFITFMLAGTAFHFHFRGKMDYFGC